ncbi:transposase [Proteiniclasticum ruminis]|uniref:transposase n=1 Tax=Proteiniclasticum ruminis TaxID=398199 RepID=UPI0035E42E7D
MSEKRRRFDEEFKKNAVKLSYASVKTIMEIASDLRLREVILYRRRQKKGPDGNKT